MRYRILALVLFLALPPACTSAVPPTITWGPSAIIADSDPRILLASNAQRDRIRESLVDSGLPVVTDTTGGGTLYQLQVKVGSSRSSTDCGTTNNVVYILSGRAGRVLVIKGRGRTGSCNPNIFDEMSAKLASQFGAAL